MSFSLCTQNIFLPNVVDALWADHHWKKTHFLRSKGLSRLQNGKSYAPHWSDPTALRTPPRGWGRPVSAGGGGADRRKRTTTHLAGVGDDAACRGVAGIGEATTSPETGTTRLAAASPAEERKNTLGFRVGGGEACRRRSWRRPKVGDRWRPKVGDRWRHRWLEKEDVDKEVNLGPAH
jgi:hypothetical protein